MHRRDWVFSLGNETIRPLEQAVTFPTVGRVKSMVKKIICSKLILPGLHQKPSLPLASVGQNSILVYTLISPIQLAAFQHSG
jgi:hypothetical protein